MPRLAITLNNDLKTLAKTIVDLVEGGDETSHAYEIMKKYGFVDHDGFWIYEDDE